MPFQADLEVRFTSLIVGLGFFSPSLIALMSSIGANEWEFGEGGWGDTRDILNRELDKSMYN
jgi:hypothetical protein